MAAVVETPLVEELSKETVKEVKEVESEVNGEAEVNKTWPTTAVFGEMLFSIYYIVLNSTLTEKVENSPFYYRQRK